MESAGDRTWPRLADVIAPDGCGSQELGYTTPRLLAHDTSIAVHQHAVRVHTVTMYDPA
jgi:hypothetical protein